MVGAVVFAAADCSARLCLNEVGLFRRRCAGKPVAEAVGVGAGGVAAAGSRSRISPIREKGDGAGSSGGWISSSSKSRTKRSPRKAMAVEGKKDPKTRYVSGAAPKAKNELQTTLVYFGLAHE